MAEKEKERKVCREFYKLPTMLCGPCSTQNGGIVVIVGDQIDACSCTRNKSKMSQPNRILPQSKETLLKSYTKRLKDDVKSILDNFTEIVKSSKVESETQVSRLTQSAQDQYEVNVRAANIVRAGESLQKLVSDMKEFLILNDFPSVNTSITERSNALQEISNHTDQQLLALKQELAVNLSELEQAYYSSSYR